LQKPSGIDPASLQHVWAYLKLKEYLRLYEISFQRRLVELRNYPIFFLCVSVTLWCI